jgi:hypothetical protein
MLLISNAKSYDWSTWFMGIMRSFIAGGAGAVAGVAGPMYQDPKDWNLGAGLHSVLVSMGIGFFISGVIHMMIFLQTHGAPEPVPPSEQAK